MQKGSGCRLWRCLYPVWEDPDKQVSLVGLDAIQCKMSTMY